MHARRMIHSTLNVYYINQRPEKDLRLELLISKGLKDLVILSFQLAVVFIRWIVFCMISMVLLY